MSEQATAIAQNASLGAALDIIPREPQAARPRYHGARDRWPAGRPRLSRSSTRPASIGIGFETWRPLLYAYVLWGVALGIGQVLTRGEDGHRALFLLPAVLFTVAMVVFPTLFGFYIALTDWNLSSFSGRKFNGLDNFWQMLARPLLPQRAAQHGVLRARGVSSNTSSPSAWRCCSTHRSGRANSSASSSCCRSCCRRWRCPG